jgi:hypothetical protein
MVPAPFLLTQAGEGYVKRVVRSSQPGRVTQRSCNPDDANIPDVALEWLAPVQ